MLVSSVQLIAMHSAVFCVVCSFVIFVIDATGDHILEVYSSIGLVITLNSILRSTFASLGRREVFTVPL